MRGDLVVVLLFLLCGMWGLVRDRRWIGNGLCRDYLLLVYLVMARLRLEPDVVVLIVL